MIPYTDLVGWRSGTAFIFGAGPSAELDFNRNPRKDLVFERPVVSVNSSIMLMPWQDESSPLHRFWISNDALCRKWGYWDLVLSARANRIVRDSWMKYADELEGFFFFWPRPTSEGVINPDDDGLAYCSSVPSSIDFCIQAGYDKVVLIGVDQSMHEGRSHFWQFWPKDKWPKGWQFLLAPQSQQRNVFSNYNNIAFEALSEFAVSKNVEIVNTSPFADDLPFTKQSLDEAIDQELNNEHADCCNE